MTFMKTLAAIVSHMTQEYKPTTPEDAPTLRDLVLRAIGHGLLTVGLVGLFISLTSEEPPPLTAILRWAVIFGLAATGLVLARFKESRNATVGIVVIGCALWLIRS